MELIRIDPASDSLGFVPMENAKTGFPAQGNKLLKGLSITGVAYYQDSPLFQD